MTGALPQTISLVIAIAVTFFAYRNATENRKSAAAIAFVIALIAVNLVGNILSGTGSSYDDPCYWVDGGTHADFRVCPDGVYP